MATSTVKRISTSEVTLVLTEREALALCHLLRRVGGDSERTVRRETSAVCRALTASLESIGRSPAGLDSVSIFGGQITARSKSSELLENPPRL